jgi:crotonobetainyl-CoA:carnitine CoA-transferase CaiB-like acyl-CoA transferase
MTDQSEAGAETGPGPLTGLRVIHLSSSLPGAYFAQFFADAGADVILVEPPGGTPIRQLPGWPGLLRGQRSIDLDLHLDDDMQALRGLLAGADVLVHGMRPSAARDVGFTAESLAADFPRLVTAHITGFGADNQWSHYKGYEGLVFAKTGVMYSKRQLTSRNGPAYVSTPYASWAAAQNAAHGALAALLEREKSGVGQVVSTSLVQGIGAMDTYNWFYEMVLERYPGAYTPMVAGFDDEMRPQAALIYALLIAPTQDGSWLQFAQTAPRLMQAWLKELGVAAMLADPKWEGFPTLPTAELRGEFWWEMVNRVRARTLAEWQETFERNPDVSGEVYRTAEEALDHPQIVHEGRAITIDQPGLGPVRQPAPMVYLGDRPVTLPGPAPAVGEHHQELRRLAAEASSTGAPPAATEPDLPLAGVTIVEFGSMFAGPYGATLLTDLGARVIKIEEKEGDNIRVLVPFPEAGGAKVLQGKESLAVDATSPEGREIVHAIVARADVVLQCMRPGAAERLGVGEAQAKELNPNMVYVNACGYGMTGPYADRPSYAPSIGAAMGLGDLDSRHRTAPPQSDEDVQRGAVTLHASVAVPAVQADGVGAVGVASTIMLGLYSRSLGRRLDGITTTMYGSALNCLNHVNNIYDGKHRMPLVDEDFNGLGVLYRMYPAADGMVFLAVPKPSEWDELVTALKPYVDLGADARFATAADRDRNATELAEELASVFATRPKADWESELTGQDVGCVAVVEDSAEKVMQGDDYYEAGLAVDAVSPIFDEHRRLAPLVEFSRSRTKADAGCTVGQHTDAILEEFGYGDRITELRAKDVVR